MTQSTIPQQSTNDHCEAIHPPPSEPADVQQQQQHTQRTQRPLNNNHSTGLLDIKRIHKDAATWVIQRSNRRCTTSSKTFPQQLMSVVLQEEPNCLQFCKGCASFNNHALFGIPQTHRYINRRCFILRNDYPNRFCITCINLAICHEDEEQPPPIEPAFTWRIAVALHLMNCTTSRTISKHLLNVCNHCITNCNGHNILTWWEPALKNTSLLHLLNHSPSTFIPTKVPNAKHRCSVANTSILNDAEDASRLSAQLHDFICIHCDGMDTHLDVLCTTHTYLIGSMIRFGYNNHSSVMPCQPKKASV